MNTVRHCLGVICACAIALLSNHAQAATLLSIDEKAKLSTNHLVITVTGTYSCGLDEFGQPEAVAIVISVRQAAGKSIAFGYHTLTPVCDGTLKQFSADVVAQADVNGNVSAPFHGGPARADAHVFVTSGNDIDFGQNISVTGGGK